MTLERAVQRLTPRSGSPRLIAVVAALTAAMSASVAVTETAAPARADNVCYTPVVGGGRCVLLPGVLDGAGVGFYGTTSGGTASTGGLNDTVTGVCDGEPTTGNFAGTTYAVHAEATSDGPDVPLATGLTCEVWDYIAGTWLSGPINGSEPGKYAFAEDTNVFIPAGSHPVGCVWADAIFLVTNKHPSSKPSDTRCPSTHT